MEEVIRVSRYARYLRAKGRRETWEEQIDRVLGMHRTKYAEIIERDAEFRAIMDSIREPMVAKRVLGAQRALHFGGAPIFRKNARMYNCAATYIDRPRVFQEIMWLLLCGCGMGISVQWHHVAKLPSIRMPYLGRYKKVHILEDSIEGWADALGILMSAYFVEGGPFPAFAGHAVLFDFSAIRPKGAPIQDISGRAPGPDPLRAALERIEQLLIKCCRRADNLDAAGHHRLTPIEAFDIIMYAADAVISGGVRRSAILTMFSPDDVEMAAAKTGDWFVTNPQRGRSNNSAMLLRSSTTFEQFERLIQHTKEFGEPGFIWTDSLEMLFNPCVEVGLYARDEKGQSGVEFCNLTEINMSAVRTPEEFLEVCRVAAIIGTLQAGYTDFDYLGPITESIVRREALLGVSMTGMMDSYDIAFNPELQRQGATLVRETNRAVAAMIGIRPAARTTCIKPAGTTSCILGTASGIHPHHARRYFRRVQMNMTDNVLKFFREHNPLAVSPSQYNSNDAVITFAREIAPTAKTRYDISAAKLLELVKLTQQNWVTAGRDLKLCTMPYLSHNVSNTISVGADEWSDVSRIIYRDRAYYAGISLLSVSGDRDYVQAPLQEVFDCAQLHEMYGDSVMFVSGLIGHIPWEEFKSLYDACDFAMRDHEDIVKELAESAADSIEKLSGMSRKAIWGQRVRQFARRHFEGRHYSDGKEPSLASIRKTIYCIKDVDAFKTWCDLKRTTVDIPWIEFREDQDNTFPEHIQACANGVCERSLREEIPAKKTAIE